MKKLFIKHLYLENYRNFTNYEISADFQPMIIIGANGSGKTNILEAISLLFPGRGLRHSKFEELCQHGTQNWQVKYKLHSKLGDAAVENKFFFENNKRVLSFNGSKITGNELSKLTNIIWLTPQMDGIFLESPKIRRKFFDRIVYSFEENHAKHITQYEYHLQERGKILQNHPYEYNWLKTVENSLSALAIKIARTRLNTLNNLMQVMSDCDNPFPKAHLLLEGSIEQQISSKADAEILDFIVEQFYAARIKDKHSGKASFGIHRTDFIVKHGSKNIAAKSCSTGEQKALLIAIILAQINFIIQHHNIKPIILLDEVFVHLDEAHKDYLIKFFSQIQAQIWITATDTHGIEKLLPISQIIELHT